MDIISRLKKVVSDRHGILVKSKITNYCTVCGKIGVFQKTSDNLRETMLCPTCQSNSRRRHVAKVIVETFCPGHSALKPAVDSLTGLKIYELSYSGPIHWVLNRLPGYYCSEYFDDVPVGTTAPSGIRCEDLKDLSFADNLFDLVISEDVLEHVDDYERAFSELNRVLKPGGCHIYTIPLYGDRKTRRMSLIKNGEVVHLEEPEYHGDLLRGRILVFNQFGTDLSEILETFGFETEILFADEHDENEFGIFTSVVLRSRKRFQ